MFKRILIANRGEIAVRIIRTAHQLGIQVVAIYSEPDAHALHVKLADEAHCVGPAPALASYLAIDKIIQIAKQTAVDAIHPGYGFLAENPEFAEKCAHAGIVFIGAPKEAIILMGSKREAKACMEKAGIPIIPGYHGKQQTEEQLLQQAKKIGFPLMIKASFGGGGKGMRIINNAKEFKEKLQSAKREAKNSFSNNEVILEKYFSPARHIEVQIFADKQGNVVHLFERDCSLQRRHQKIIEITPAKLSPATRKKLLNTAILATQAIHYCGAGTIEFLVDDKENFYFMEMNTRLQVEHPITEMVTGIDLVAWQLCVAAGESIPLQQSQITTKGTAIEARIYAEDPQKDFLPATGKLTKLFFPKLTNLRVDTGIAEHDEIQPYYDPMLVKMITWGENWQQTINHMLAALRQTIIVGCKNNLEFLIEILQQKDFHKNNVDVSWLEKHIKKILTAKPTEKKLICAAGILYLLSQRKSADVAWHQNDYWQLNLIPTAKLRLTDGYEVSSLTIQMPTPNKFLVTLQEKQYPFNAELSGEFLHLDHHEYQYYQHNGQILIFSEQERAKFTLINEIAEYDQEKQQKSNLISPMPGLITAILVKAGHTVTAGTKLLTLEAMKMEHTITAPFSGKVTAIHYKVGDQVQEGVQLLAFEAE